MKILIATDGSDHAREAAGLFAEIADRSRCQVTVLSVIEGGVFMPKPVADLKALEAGAVQATASTTSILRSFGFAAEPMIVEGLAGEEIVKLAAEGGYDLVVCGAGEKGRAAKLLMGSVGRYVLQHAHTSTLIVRERVLGANHSKALVGVDSSAGSDLAVAVATHLLDPDRVQVSVVSIAEDPVGVSTPPLMSHLAGMTIYDDSSEVLEQASSIARKAASVFAAEGFFTTSFASLGDVRRNLIEETLEGGFDVVIVGSRQLGMVGRALLGSVSSWMSHEAPATLVVKGSARRWVTNESLSVGTIR